MYSVLEDLQLRMKFTATHICFYNYVLFIMIEISIEKYLVTILICCCCIIYRKRRQIRKRRKVYFLVEDWKQNWKMTLLIMVNLTVATAMTTMTSCDEGSSSPFLFPLCPDAPGDMQHLPVHATQCHLEHWTMCQSFTSFQWWQTPHKAAISPLHPSGKWGKANLLRWPWIFFKNVLYDVGHLWWRHFLWLA